jgi:hypothetical protein
VTCGNAALDQQKRTTFIFVAESHDVAFCQAGGVKATPCGTNGWQLIRQEIALALRAGQ